MKFKYLTCLIATVLVMTFVGCHPLFCNWERGYNVVENQGHAPVITGEYRLTRYSEKMMRYEGNYKNIPDSRLYLQPDGKFKITNAPDWLITESAESYGQYVLILGKWNFECDDKTGCVLELDGLQTGELVHEKDQKTAVLLTIGDPDSCQGMVYEKVN